MKLHYRSADIDLLLLDIIVWRDDELTLVDNDSGENLNKFTEWTRRQNSERFKRKWFYISTVYIGKLSYKMLS